MPDTSLPVEAGPLQGLTSIAVSPATASLTAGDQVSTQAFTAMGTFADGSTRDVTALVSWSAYPPALIGTTGTVVRPTGNAGGDGTMNAVSGSVTGTAKVHVTFAKTVLATGAAPGSDGKFGGAGDVALNPALLYPLDGALFPPNLDAPDIQWTPAANTSLFDVHLQADSLDLHVYTPCNVVGAGCSLVPDAATWAAVTATLAGNGPASVTVRATDGNGGAVGTSAPSSIQLAQTAIKGGLYYFNTRGQKYADGGFDKPGVFRYDFDQAALGEFFTQQACAGCHALSLDGTKMLAPICTDARGCGRPLQLAVVDVATRQFITPPFPVGDSDTQAWTPDNKYYVTTPSCGVIPADPKQACSTWSGGIMNLVDATTNTLVGQIPAGAGADFPAFSSDGKHLVYARGTKYNGPLSLTSPGLFTLDFDATQPAASMWSAEKTLLASSGEANYYPSFSPDDQWVLFTRSQCAAGDDPSLCDTYDDPSARAFVMPAAGGTPIELKKANGPGKLDNSWARWSPFKGNYKDGEILWLTFSSVRDYGVRVTTPAQGAHVRQLWLIAFDTNRARAGLDPSFAPVWLPFQDVEASNHIAQWTTKVVGGVK